MFEVDSSKVAGDHFENGRIRTCLNESGSNFAIKIKTSSGVIKTVTIPFD